MALYKRGTTWWVRFTTPNGNRLRKSTGTTDKSKAQEFHDRIKAEYWRTEKLGDIPEKLWDEAAILWLSEMRHKSDNLKDAGKLKWLNKYLGGMKLKAITREEINRIAEIKAKESKHSTVNRYLALIRAILRKSAHEWGWLESVPKIRLYQEPIRRIRWLTREQADRLIEELPVHQVSIVRFALATGLRQANIVSLKWSQVNLSRGVAWIHPDQAKARKAIAVPLNKDAVTVLMEQKDVHPVHVFTYKGKPFKQANTRAWKLALIRAGITDFRWHDLRHTWASWHVQAGTPLNVLQELGGWECVEMVRRYAHFAPEHLAEHADRIVV